MCVYLTNRVAKRRDVTGTRNAPGAALMSYKLDAGFRIHTLFSQIHVVIWGSSSEYLDVMSPDVHCGPKLSW